MSIPERKPINLVVQYVPTQELLTATQICQRYGLKSSSGTDHTSLIDHMMVLYYLDTKIPFIIDVGWSGYSSQRTFHWPVNQVEFILKTLYHSQGKKRRGRMELPTAEISWGKSPSEKHCFYSGKAYVFQLKDTDQHAWEAWDSVDLEAPEQEDLVEDVMDSFAQTDASENEMVLVL